jgi:hypothetical protein
MLIKGDLMISERAQFYNNGIMTIQKEVGDLLNGPDVVPDLKKKSKV